ncbi:MAG: RNA-binding protein [Gammaproteobacteria bacterium]|nr:RNA-binding protein [Gammaproteobacteria bacterium]|tara:strand:- start:1026 stop:1295 length:270 start_codon:yes stop_codon:yes gene_type:complete
MTSNTPDNPGSQPPSDALDVEVNTVPVELYKILKFEGLVGSGAEAKAVVADGMVRVNDIVEIQKRKKIVAGDVIEFAGQRLRIVFTEAG